VFITFEGIDGCGKTTQIDRLKSYFEETNRKCHTFREPGGTAISEEVRKLLLHGGDEMNSVTELLLFSAARSQLMSEQVIPLLNKGEIVILDRFYDSTIAYQGYGRNSAPIEEIQYLNKLASHHTIPDLTFYLKISPKTAKKRTEGAEKDRMEKAGDSFFSKVTDGFDQLSRSEERIRVVDGNQTESAIHLEIREIVDNCII